nr:translation initiation factor IF-2-like [Pongo abelii]
MDQLGVARGCFLAKIPTPPGCALFLPSLRCLRPQPPGSQEACGGGAPPSSSGCSTAVSRRQPVWKTSPRQRDGAGAGPRPAPRAGRTRTAAQYLRRSTPGGPSAQHARVHSPARPGPGRRRDHPHPRPQGRAGAQQPPAPALGPTPSATPRHANTPPAPAGARPAQPPPPQPRRPHLATLRAPLGAAPSPPSPCSAPGRCGGMGPARGGSALPRHRDTRGRGRGMSANSHAPPPVRRPRPISPPLGEPRLAPDSASCGDAQPSSAELRPFAGDHALPLGWSLRGAEKKPCLHQFTHQEAEAQAEEETCSRSQARQMRS